MAVVSESFITLEDARRHLRLAIDDRQHDHRLEECVNAAAHVMLTVTGRRLKDETYSDKYLTGDGTVLLSLPEYPVDPTYTMSIRVSTTRAWGSETDLIFWNGNSGEDAENAEVVVADEGAAILERVDGGVWPRIARSIRISYKAGYASTDDRYHQLFEAQLLVTNWFWENEGLSQMVRGENAPGVSRTYVMESLPSRAMAILRAHTRGGVALC